MRKFFLDDMENFSKKIEDEKSMSLNDIIQYTKHSLILNDCY